MQEASGFSIFGQVTESVGFNANIGFVRPRGGGGVVVDNFLNTESDFDIQAENDDDIILDQ
jgi:hypothetical protein